jgi:hypothetical protein
VSRASVLLAASDWGEAAREDEKLGHDIYTHFLVEALRIPADRNGDGAVTVSEAHDYARRLTYEFTGGRQRPSAETSEVGADPIVLVGKVTRAGRPELYSYAAALDGFELLIDGRPLAELPGGVAVDPGRHRVQLTKGGGAPLFDDRVSLDAGQRIDLQELVARADGRWQAGPRLGVLSFFDPSSQGQFLGPVGTIGVAVALRDWPGRDLVLRADVTGSTGTASYVGPDGSAPYDYQVWNAGVAVAWRTAPRWMRGGELLAGPRLSALSVKRTFTTLELAGAPQSYFTFMPGLMAGAGMPLGKGFNLAAEMHLDWAVVRVDGQDQSMGFGELVLGLEYRFW